MEQRYRTHLPARQTSWPERTLRVPKRHMDVVAQPQPIAVMTSAQPTTSAPSIPFATLFPLDIPKSNTSLRLPRHLLPSRETIMQLSALILLGFSLYVSVNTWLLNKHVIAQTSQGVTTSAGTSDPQVVDGNQGVNEAPITNFAEYKVPPDSPRFIYIDKLHVQARILKLGIGSDGALQTPRSSYDTGWYTESAEPGGNGAMLVDGHALGPTKPGVFFDLKKLAPGDAIRIERGDGKTFTYIVNKVDIISAKDVPMDKLLVPIVPGKKGLNLISCTGTYNARSETFNNRAVVYATMR